MKYKIGDKVRIKDGLKCDEHGVCTSMLGYRGKVMTIEEMDCNVFAYYLVEDDRKFMWDEDVLEPVGLPKGLVSVHDVDTHELWTTSFIIPKDRIDALVDAWAMLGHTTVNLVADEAKEVIEKTEEKKMPTKFTFYVTEGTRPDKNPDGDGKGVIPTMTTTVTNGLDEVSVTCNKADYSERQGVLEGIAQLYCKGRFDKEYEAAVKINKREDRAYRTCCYCGKVFDTVEERAEHEAWHVERRKARHERYLLRKRAKEIAFEEQAQKMAREIIAENKKEAK